MASFFSKYHQLFQAEQSAQPAQNQFQNPLIPRPSSLRIRDVEMQLKLLQEHQLGIKKNKNITQRYNSQNNGPPPATPNNPQSQRMMNERKRLGHRFPEIEETGLRIGGDTQPPSPRRIRQMVTGVASIELSKLNQLGSLLIHPDQSQTELPQIGGRFQNKNILQQIPSLQRDISPAGFTKEQRFSIDASHPAGLSAIDMDRLRDLKHNFQVDNTNKNRIWQESGGMFDRSENTGVAKQIYIPGAPIQDYQVAEFHRNKQKHQSSVIRWDNYGVEQPENQNSPNSKNVVNMSPKDKKQFVMNKISYLQSSSQAQGQYDNALKRRHGAKRMVEQRQLKLKAMISDIKDFY